MRLCVSPCVGPLVFESLCLRTKDIVFYGTDAYSTTLFLTYSDFGSTYKTCLAVLV